MGWGIQPSVADRGGPALVHGGSDGTWYALLALLPDSRSGALVTANAGENMGGVAAAKVVLRDALADLGPAST